MFDEKAFYIEVIEKNKTNRTYEAKPIDDSIKELIIYAVKATIGVILVGAIVHVASELLISHLS